MTMMRNWSAFRLTLALTALNAVLFFNSTLDLFHRELRLKLLKLLQHPQNSCLRFSQVNTSTACSALWIHAILLLTQTMEIFIPLLISNETTLSALIFEIHAILLYCKKIIPLNSSSNTFNCTTIILLKTINNFDF